MLPVEKALGFSCKKLNGEQNIVLEKHGSPTEKTFLQDFSEKRVPDSPLLVVVS